MSKRGQYTYDQVVNQLQYEMSIDSSEGNRIKLATRFSDFIYMERWHNLCLDNQIFCANHVMKLFNIEPEKAVAIQLDIIRAYEIAYQMLAVDEIIQQQHIAVTNVINCNLLSTNKLQPKTEPLQILPSPKEYQGAIKVEGNTQKIIEFMNVEAGKCWGSNALRDTKVINLSNTNTTGAELENLAYTMRQFNFNLDKVLVQNNNIGDNGIHALINGITSTNLQTVYSAESGWKPVLSPLKVTQSVVYLNLSHTNMGDAGAEIIANALAHGQLSATRSVDVSGNNITSTGESFFAKALKSSIVQDIIILTRQIQDHSKLLLGTKEEKIAGYKELLKQAAANGATDKAIVVDKSIWKVIKNNVHANAKTFTGFIKCHWSLEEEIIQIYAENKLIAKLPKILGKTIDAYSAVSCYLEAHNDAWTSPSGQQALANELCVMGEQEFCGEQ